MYELVWYNILLLCNQLLIYHYDVPVEVRFYNVKNSPSFIFFVKLLILHWLPKIGLIEL